MSEGAVDSVLQSVSAKPGDDLEGLWPGVLSVRQAGWWASKAVWAVLDQGLFAISNFILSVLLARWLTAEQFGSFAVAQSVFLLAGTFHAGLVTEPMLVFGSARYATVFMGYLDVLLYAHWRLTAAVGVLMAFAAALFWVTGSLPLAGALLGIAVASPFILFGWLVRRACFSCLQPQWSAAGGALYLVLLLTVTFGLRSLELLSACTAVLAMGGSGFVSAMWILRRLRRARSTTVSVAPTRGDVCREHWNYGRWAVASSGLSWIPGNIYAVLLPAFAGLEAAGALKALSNVALPIMHATTALATLLIPALAGVRGTSRFNRLLGTSLAAFAAGSLAYWALLTTFRGPLIAYLYAGAYDTTTSLVPVVALLPLSGACMAVLGSALRVLERPQQVFSAYVISVVATITIGIPLLSHWGLAGAAVGLLLSSVVTATACAAFLLFAPREAPRGV